MTSTTAYEISTYTGTGANAIRVYRDRAQAEQAVTAAHADLGDYGVSVTTLLRPEGYPVDLRFWVSVEEFLAGHDSTEDC